MEIFNLKGIDTKNVFLVQFLKLLDIGTLIKVLLIYLKVATSLLAYIYQYPNSVAWYSSQG